MFLKIDFDKWKTEDDDEISTINTSNLKDYDDEHLAERPSFSLESLRKTYLFVYNLWQFLGFTYIFSILITKYSKLGAGIVYYLFALKLLIKNLIFNKSLVEHKIEFMPVAYQTVHYPLKFCQLMQTLEIFHPIFGYTKGSVIEPLVQVGGRSVILFCLIEAEERIQDKPVILYLILCWSAIELVRLC